MKKIAFFYVWLLPVVWCVLAVLSFFNSGDEHGLFVFGTYPATSIIIYVIAIIHNCIFPFDMGGFIDSLPLVLLVGVILISLAALLLDWLRAGKKLFFILFVLGIIILFSYSFKVYGSLERMRSKNGSVFAVFVFVCHLSLYMSIVISAIAATARKLPFFRKAQIDRSD